MNKWEMAQSVLEGEQRVVPEFTDWVGGRADHHGRLYLIPNYAAEEVRLETILDVIENLVKFDPSRRPSRNPNTNFHLWTNNIARNIAVNYWRQQLRDQRVGVPDNEELEHDRDPTRLLEEKVLSCLPQGDLQEQEVTFRDQILTYLDQILKPSQYEVISLRMGGSSLGETANQLKISYHAARVREHRALPLIEGYVLSPAGLERAYNLAEEFGLSRQQVIVAVGHGIIPSIHLYSDGLRYSTRDHVQAFANKLKVPEERKREGRVPLTSLTPKEYGYLELHGATLGIVVQREKIERRRPKGLDLLYISISDLDRLRKEREKIRLARSKPPKGLVSVAEAATTRQQYNRLKYAVKKGRLKTVLKDSRHFARREDIDAILQKKSSS